MTIQDELKAWLAAAVQPWKEKNGLSGEDVFTMDEPPTGIAADFASNLPLILSAKLKKEKAVNLPARKIAEELLQTHLQPSGIVKEVTIAGPGFLNITLALDRYAREMVTILKEGDAYGRSTVGAGKKVNIEFVSANPTGPLHVGHGRGAALGDSLAMVLEHLGYEVTREYYINDAGNQVQLLTDSVLARVRELQGQPLVLPEEGYHGDYLVPLAEALLKEHPERATDPATIRRFALDAMQKAIARDLADFSVRFDSWVSEQDDIVEKKLQEKAVEELRRRDCVKEYDDAIWFVPNASEEKAKDGEEENEFKDKDRVLKRRDGRWTYFATDIAYHHDKFSRKFDLLIDIWGADHHGYVPRVKGSMQALAWDASKLHVVLYQLVSLLRAGKPVSMSKRSGDFVTLREVLDEVGKDACRFFFAMRGPNTALDFDLELAKKNTNENPVYYLQYAHARICSIFRQAAQDVDATADFGLLKEKEEVDLMRRLAQFPILLTFCAREDSPHPLATYLLVLCRQFHHFYDHHRVLGVDPSLSKARLGLIGATRSILRKGLALLGVSAPDTM